MCMNEFQNRYHSHLENYFYGNYLTKHSKYFYPYMQKWDKTAVKGVKEDMLNILKASQIEKSSMTGLLSEMYKYMIAQEKPQHGLHPQVITCKNSFNNICLKSDSKSRTLKLLVKYLKSENIEEYVDSLLLHGSYSTQDYIPEASDLDLLIVLKESTLLSPKRLENFQKILYKSYLYFYRIDVHQHHGYFVLTPYDLRNYPQHYFPTILFNYASTIIGKASFKITTRDSRTERFKVMKHTIKYLANNDPGKITHIYYYKIYLSVLQLLPVAYYQYHGNHLYKRDSFREFIELYPLYARIYEACNVLRRDWHPEILHNEYYERILYFIWPNPKIKQLINNRLYPRVPEYMKNLIGSEIYYSNVIALMKQIGDEFGYV